jgi:hypothetical protein
MKKYFTLLFLLMFGIVNQSFASYKTSTRHHETPLVLAQDGKNNLSAYFPWEMASASMMMADCPGDIAVEADPGECSREITYDFNLVSSNPPPQELVTQNNDPDLVNATIFCPIGQTRFRRTFTNVYQTPFVLNDLEIGVYQSSNSPSVTINVYDQSNNLIFTKSELVPTLSMSVFTTSLDDIVIPPGESYSVEVVTPPPFVSIFRMGRNDAGNTTGEAQISSETCAPSQMLVSGAAMANSVVLSVLGTAEEFIIVNNSLHPYESGDAFPVGTHLMDYQIFDWEGDEILDCQFQINVFSYEPSSTTIACNDQVNVTLGLECSAEVGAEYILKGDFYGCYDDYEVDITSLQGFSLGNTVGKAQIGQTLRVKVTAPDGNFCWGHILVEDKFGPVFTCNDVYTTCVGDLTPGSPMSSRINLPAFIEENILFPGTPNSRSYVIPVNNFSGFSISDVGVHLNVSHTRVSDLVATVQAPNGMSVTLFVGPGSNAGPCTGDDLLVDIFDDATQTNAALLSMCNMVAPAVSGEFRPLTSLSIFDGIDPTGYWTVTIHDVSNGEGGTINEVVLSFDQVGAEIPFPYSYDVNWIDLGNQSYWIENGDYCTNAIITYQDEILEEGCEGPYVRVIRRCWDGFDEYDNHANTCCQTLYVYRNGLSAIIFPPNYDDVDEPALSCADYGTVIPGLDVTGTVTGDFCDNVQIVPYTDVILPICKNSYKIIRTHKVIEWCNSLVLEHNQIIKVVDDEGPDMECPADMTISTNQYDCFATRVFDRPEILFDCSDNFTYNLSHAFGPFSDDYPCQEANYTKEFANQNTRTVSNLPIGHNFIKWEVKDECDNISECCTRVTVRDDILPTAVCHLNTVVSIAANQQAIVNATSFDDGSHDNCAIRDIEVRKTVNSCAAGNTLFAKQAIFCCAEIGQEIMVEMKVTDVHGNMNTCMVRATVQDKLPPFVKCPPNVTLDCQADYEDLDITGEPSAVDNCSVKEVVKADDPHLTQCGTGYITRTWTAEDFQGLKHSCIQTITLIDVDPFDGFDINDLRWPDNYETNQCGAALLPENLPLQFARPRVSDDECSLIAMHYKDQVFSFVDGACEKILRTWTVLDWCTYNEQYPVYGEGWFEHVQIIKMHNTEPPVIEASCADRTVFSYGNCEGEVSESITAYDLCTPSELINYTYTIDLYDDGSINFSGNTNNYTRVLPDGTHKVRWTAEDKCGNVSVCQYLLTVVDGKKPTPYCLSSITTAVMNSNGQVEIWAIDYDLGSTDNCTDYDDLWFTFDGATPVRSLLDTEHYFKGNGLQATFTEYVDGIAQKWIPATNSSGRLFSCNDISNGDSEELLLDMSVTDLVGNSDFCTITLVLQDNSNVCENSNGLVGTISGRITLADARPLKGANLILESNQPEYPKSILSGQTGTFQFTNVKKNFDYQLSAVSNEDLDEGLSTLDIVLIQRHILGVQTLNNPYMVIAGDIDANEKINSLDLVGLRKVILGTVTEFPNQQKSWKFIPASVSFVDPNHPWPMTEKMLYPNFQQNKNNQNFVAVKIGDVNNSIVLNVDGDLTEARTNKTLSFLTEKVTASKGETVRIPVYAEGFKDMSGFQMTTHFDPEVFDFVGVESGAIEISDAHIGVFDNKPGVLTTSWNSNQPENVEQDKIAFYWVLTAKKDVDTDQIFVASSQITTAAAYDSSLKSCKVEYRSKNESESSANVFVLRQNVPNPFTDQTTISFTLPSDEQADLKIMDVAGKVVYSSSKWYDKGTHHVNIDKSVVRQSGVFYYQISAGSFFATKKMIFIE